MVSELRPEWMATRPWLAFWAKAMVKILHTEDTESLDGAVSITIAMKSKKKRSLKIPAP